MLQAEESGAGAGLAFSSPAAPAAPSPAAPAALAPVAQEQPPALSLPHGQRTSTAREEIFSSFYRLPQRFTRTDVCKMLGYEPDRGTLFRILRELVDQGALQIVERGAGQRATVYAKTVRAEVPSQE